MRELEPHFIKRYRFFIIAILIIIAYLIYIFVTDRLPQFFLAEAFYEIQWAETKPFWEALLLTIEENGRIFSWVYTVGLYEILGYQPAIYHLLAIVLDFLAATSAAVAIYRIWPKRLRPDLALPVVLLLAFFFPYSTNWSVYFASDHYYLTILIFFLSIITLQEWARRGLKTAWFIAGLAIFLLALFTYEHISLLFPVALLMAYPLIPAAERSRTVNIKLIVLGMASLAFVFLPLIAYLPMQSTFGSGFVHPAFSDNPNILNEVPERVVASVGYLFNFLYRMAHSLRTLTATDPLLLVFLLCLVAWIGWGLYANYGGRGKAVGAVRALEPQDRERVAILGLSAVLLILLGLAPYAAWGSLALPDVRFYSVPLFGIVTLLALAWAISARRWMQGGLAIVCVLAIAVGLWEYSVVSSGYLAAEYAPTEDYLSVVELVPRVSENTTFIFVDNPIGSNPWTGCALAFRVLYDTQGLRCAHLSTFDARYSAVRDDLGFRATEGGGFHDGNWIIIGTTPDGTRYIIPELTPEDKVLITWESTEPITTDYRRIIEEQGPPDTQMYYQLVGRWAQAPE